ncbi:outer membrane beta-barrel protein [Dongshaea marina]|uniref:outer membrane beta-barrel protein n=1 Tax=Dongshaea marina TaxID=2047966 RepID=UPI000D3E95A1|nr:outer membrane beta-barrel protein [Dongshaea marina]
MKKLLIASMVAATVAASGAAFAQDTSNSGAQDTNTSGSSIKPMGPYVKGELGWADQDSSGDNMLSGRTNSDLGGRVAAGYNFDLNPKVSVAPEIGYGYYGKGSKDGTDAKYHALDLSGVGTYHLNEKIDLFGKAGMAYKSVDFEHGSWTETSDDYNGWTPLVGVGAGYNLTPQLQAQVTYTHMFEHQSYALDSVMAGLKYNF